MIKIECEADLGKLRDRPGMNPMIVHYMSTYLCQLLLEYRCESLSQHGGLVFLEDRQDGSQYTAFGLSQPLRQATPEYSETITLKGKHGKTRLLHACLVFSNSYALSLFARPGTLDEITEANLLEDSTFRTVTID